MVMKGEVLWLPLNWGQQLPLFAYNLSMLCVNLFSNTPRGQNQYLIATCIDWLRKNDLSQGPRTQNVNPLGGVCLAEWTVGASNDPIRVTTIIFVKYWFFSPTSDNQSNNKPLFALNNFPISKFVFNCLPLFVLYLNRGLAFAIDFQLPLSLDKYPDVSSRAASMVQSDGPERDGW